MKLLFSVLSDVGRVRSGNEDSAHGRLDPNGTHGLLLVVADGMGGAAAGEVASRMAVDTVDEVYFGGSEAPDQRLLDGLLTANTRIAEASEEREGARGMGTTCTALAIVGTTAYVAHVGDSRAYLLRGGTITRLTRDMSVWADRVRGGVPPSSEYGRNQLAEAVGVSSELAPQTRDDIEVAVGDRFLLCSDGLWGLVTDPELQRVAHAGPLEDACRTLVDLANARGGADNVTVVLAAVAD
jgi:protein phosphatase